MAIHEIRVTPNQDDPLGHEVKAEIERTLGFSELDDVSTAKVYRVEGITDEEARILAEKAFTDPVSESYKIDEPINFDTAHVAEVAYKPGVMNPEAASIMKAANDLGILPKAADSSREYAFFGELTKTDVDSSLGRLLVNKTVEQVVSEKPETLTFEGSVGPIETIPVRTASKQELADISKDKLFLNDEEMGVVQQYFRELDRDPTDAELEVIAARWSEHCGHKTFNAKVVVDGVEKAPLFSRIKNAAKEYFERESSICLR